MASPFSADIAFFNDQRRFDAEMQRREAAEDRAVAEFKMNRDMASIRLPHAASEAAIHYLTALMTEKAVSQGQIDAGAEISAWISRHNDKATVSANIDRLKAEGFTGRSSGHLGGTARDTFAVGANEVPAGRYAVYNDDQSVNDLAFYQVDRPTEGRWVGYVFVKRFASDELIRISRSQERAILRKIAEMGAVESSTLYGRNDERCGICHRKLTVKASRERGIGPDCAAKMGW